MTTILLSSRTIPASSVFDTRRSDRHRTVGFGARANERSRDGRSQTRRGTLAGRARVASAARVRQAPGPGQSVPAGANSGKVDTRYIAPTAAVVVVVRPSQILASPIAQVFPVEVASAAGMKHLGFDPTEMEEVDWVRRRVEPGHAQLRRDIQIQEPDSGIIHSGGKTRSCSTCGIRREEISPQCRADDVQPVRTEQ